MTQARSIDLHCTAGGSDKVYHVALIERGGGWAVDVKYGRRGGTLKHESKTPVPVGSAQAVRIYEKLIKEKLAKAYVPVAGEGTRMETPVSEAQQTGLVPQLLNFVGESEVEPLLNDPAWLAQPKYDGERRLVRIEPGKPPVGSNRRGLAVTLPAPLIAALSAIKVQAVLDGEQVGDTFYAFDCLEMGGTDLRSRSTSFRVDVLEGLFASGAGSAGLPKVVSARTTTEKCELYATLKAAQGEGIVFKLEAAPYIPGRPNSGGDWRKFKFYATGSFEVAAITVGKRSSALRVYAGETAMDVGKVTVPANQPMPAVGDVLEVRYLYAYTGGALFQSTYLGRRSDLTREACTAAQLKFKAEERDEEMEA